MLKHIMRLAVAAPLFAGWPLAASAMDPHLACNARDNVVSALAEQFSEIPVANGLTQGGQLMEVFASAQGTWTLILSLPSGQSCLIANGDDWDGSVNEVSGNKLPPGPREGISLVIPKRVVGE